MQLCKEQLTYFVLDERDRVEKAIPLFGSWYSKSTSELTDKGMTFAQVTECRIPAEYAPQGFAPKENDMLLRGTFDGDPPAAALLKHRYLSLIHI